MRIANGGVIEDGVMTKPRVPVQGVEASQVAEYLRSFLASRIAWAGMNGLLIISGASGVFLGRRAGWGTIPRGAALAQAPVNEAPELAPVPLSR